MYICGKDVPDKLINKFMHSCVAGHNYCIICVLTPSQRYPLVSWWVDGKCHSLKVHRLAYELWIGPIPGGMLVCHTCDIPRCVNPNHLFAGTDLDNQRDMIAKGRENRVGQESASFLLPAMLELKAEGLSAKCIALRLGLNKGTVYAYLKKHREGNI